jgi:ubiquinone/menaquinone biosynthesis C-methylase UbiE
MKNGRYLGIDVVDELIAHSASVAGRPDWRFERTNGLVINEQDGQADFVCFFSVMTHLLHEESFTYLREAKRVLRPGGKVVISFLEFQVQSHWAVFEHNLSKIGSRYHLNPFMSRDGIQAWARHLGLRVEAIFDGDTPHIPLPEPVVLDDGTVAEGKGNLGQSICILVKDA